jgi:hypothetical protein
MSSGGNKKTGANHTPAKTNHVNSQNLKQNKKY